ncbi:MAG: CHAT domain-containing protein [bacterium]
MISSIDNLSVNEILEIFKKGNQNERIEFVEDCPSMPFKEEALQSAQSSIPEMVPQSMDFLAHGCLLSGNYELGKRIAKSCYLLAREGYEADQGDTMTLRMIAGRAALNWMTTLQNIGLHQDTIKLIDEPIEWLRSIGDTDNLYMVLLKRIESELDLEEYDEAEKHLNEIDESSLPTFTQVQYRALKYRIDQHKGGGTDLLGKVKCPGREELIDVLGPLGCAKETEETQEDSLEYYKSLKDIAGVIIDSEVLGTSGALNVLTVKQKIIDASYLFTDPEKGNDPEEIAKIEPILIFGRDWMKEHHFPDTENEACWSLYLAYNRTNREEQAVEQLQRIRTNIENARSKIADPVERARLSERYPYLYASLCTLFYKLGRYKELMEAIEASKSRILADIQTKKTGKPATEREFSKALNELPNWMKELSSHYLTTFVDDDWMFCAMQTSLGHIEATKVAISKESINYLGSISNPELWGKPDPSNPFGPRIPNDVPQQLSRLIEFIGPLLDEGQIKEGEHLCYSPHDALLIIPFHYMEVNGRPLVELFSLSRIPGAHSLDQIFKRNAQIPEYFIHVEVPSRQDLENQAKVNAFKEAGKWLNKHMKGGTMLVHEEADIGKLSVTNLQDKLLHFATHGRFPDGKLKIDPNPFKSAGLILSANEDLPDLEILGKGEGEEHILSPEKILDLKLDFSNSHVTLQACVSGLAKRGFGGDPLGLEWAFLQNGATSILSTNWQTSAQTTSQFATTFYNYWLKKGNSRAIAWRNTVLEFKNTDKTSDPYHWAAFSLIGDWR